MMDTINVYDLVFQIYCSPSFLAFCTLDDLTICFVCLFWRLAHVVLHHAIFLLQRVLEVIKDQSIQRVLEVIKDQSSFALCDISFRGN